MDDFFDSIETKRKQKCYNYSYKTLIVLLISINTILQIIILTNLHDQIKPAHNLIEKFKKVYTDFSKQQEQLQKITPYILHFFKDYVPNSETFMNGITTCLNNLSICN